MIITPCKWYICFFFFQAEDGIRDLTVTGVQTCALPICEPPALCDGRHGPTGHRTAAAGGAARTMVVGDPGADRAAACSPAARRQGAELGTQRRPASVGSEHGNLYGRTESLVAVLRRPRFPPRRATPRRRWAHYGRAWPTEHEPVRSQH